MADNYCGCSGNGETPEYIINLNTQGPPGQQGPQGEQGYSPVVSYVMTPDDINFTFINEETIETTPNFFQYVPKLDLSNINNPININSFKLEKIAGAVPGTFNSQLTTDNYLFFNTPGLRLGYSNPTSDTVQMSLANDGTYIGFGPYSGNNLLRITSTEATYKNNEIATVDQIPSTSTFLKVDGTNANSIFNVNGISLTSSGITLPQVQGYGTSFEIEDSVSFTGFRFSHPGGTFNAPVDGQITYNTTRDFIFNRSAANKLYYHGSQPDNEVATIGDIPEVIEYKAGDNITFTNNPDGTVSINGQAGGGSSYTLPPATTSTLGGIKVGTNLTIEEDGTLNAQAGSSELDTYLSGNTTGNITTITAKEGKALELSAPTIAVGNNLVNNINGTDSQLYLKQGDIVAGTNITVTKTSTGIVINSTGGGGSSTTEKYGIEGDYATHYGILDCPNGLIDYNATGKEITLNQGIVLQLAGQDNKTTIATAITKTLESTSNIILFYGGGELLEVGKVDYSLEEPTDNGVDNYQAWYNPSLGKWQFKSNDTGNIWRELIATPIANIYMNNSNITRVDYIGYRILDDDILVQQSEIETLNETIATLTNTINALEARIAALETNINGGNA